MTRWLKGLFVAAPLLVILGCVALQGWTSRGTAQGWTWGQRDAWYVADQGSRLIPRAWIDALEQPDGAPRVGNGKFVDPVYLAQFNYTPASMFARKNVDASCPIDADLPIGFVTDCQNARKFGVTNLTWRAGQKPTEPWVGMNCSACHTNAVEFHYADGKPDPTQTVLIDGAPTLGDFQGFMAALETSLEQTLADDRRFARFAAAVLPAGESQADRSKLQAAMASLIAWNQKLATLNADATTRYGDGRLDAIGHIFNKVALAALPDGTQTSNPADAPVSYPFLWNVPQLDKVEWNGIAPNLPIKVLGIEDPGALVRNTGEVTGVFADLTVAPHVGAKGYASSARIDRLDEMEQQLRSLHAPAWPARFGLNRTTDKTSPAYARSVDRGSDLFAVNCASCHAVPKAFGDTSEKFKVKLTPVADLGTDMWMACNTSFDQAQAGAFTGEQQNLVVGNPIPASASNFSLVQAGVVGTLLGQKAQLVGSVLRGVLGLDNGLPQPPPPLRGYQVVAPKEFRANACRGAMAHPTDPHNAQLVYKGRPLQGIWATAPYLHNGSVPSLYTLLLPPEKRPKTFCVGSRLFDPKEVGFAYQGACATTFQFNVTAADGSAIPGNSNAGHVYGTGLTDDDRYALIEYMKTL
jgi:hypothetical protein